MPVDALAIPIPADRLAALDALADRRHTDRAALVNEAVADYLAQQEGWARHLAAGLRQAEAGEFASESAVAAAFASRAGSGREGYRSRCWRCWM